MLRYPTGMCGAGELDDAVLLRRSVDDAALFGELHRRHADAVVAFFFRRTGCAHTAADLCGETFAAAFVGRNRFQDRGAPVRAWLFGIARRQLGSYLRRQRVSDRHRRRMGVEPIDLTDRDIERIEDLVDLEPVRIALAAALDALPQTQVAAVRLRILDDLSYAAVAERLGVSEGAARVRVSRALRTLADTMGATT